MNHCRSQPGLACMLLVLTVGPYVPAHAAELAVLQNGFSIRHQRHEVQGEVTRLYLGTQEDSGYIEIPTSQVLRYEPDDSAQPVAEQQQDLTPERLAALVEEASRRHGLDPDLVLSVIAAESAFDPKAISPKGAQGLMQLMPATARELEVEDAFDPNANVQAGVRYLRQLLDAYQHDLIRALAAYNAGPHRVDQYQGVPPYPETARYVARVVRDFNRKKLAARPAKQ